MRFANAVNGLVVSFHRLETNAPLGVDMLVMERLYPSISAPTRRRCAKSGLRRIHR
ncbi:MAG: hypothetical protein WKG07_17560 [Hymenobacter sp.]